MPVIIIRKISSYTYYISYSFPPLRYDIGYNMIFSSLANPTVSLPLISFAASDRHCYHPLHPVLYIEGGNKKNVTNNWGSCY